MGKVLFAQVNVVIKPDVTRIIREIPKEFSGIAYEISEVTPDRKGNYYFGPRNHSLIQMIKTLGIKTIRIGGNTADLTTFTFPGKRDVDSLFLFARAAGVVINYTLRLNNGDVAQNAALAKYIYDRYKKNLQCFAIGNETDLFIDTYPHFIEKWKPHYEAIVKAAPGVKFAAPSLAGRAPEWSTRFLNDYGSSGNIKLISIHDYPGGAGNAVTNAIQGIDEMLSEKWVKKYEAYAKLYKMRSNKSIPFQMEEGNNFYNGGAPQVSDTYAAALWSLNYLYWWAAHYINGINFQNGDYVAKGKVLTPCKYASFVTAPGGYYARPSAYGIKAFDIGGHGQILKTDIEFSKAETKINSLNLTAYSVLSKDKKLVVTVINKEHFAAGKAADIKIVLQGHFYKNVQLMYLRSVDENVSAKSGVTLGGASIQTNGTWKGKWTKPVKMKNKNLFRLSLSKATAVMVKFSNH